MVKTYMGCASSSPASVFDEAMDVSKHGGHSPEAFASVPAEDLSAALNSESKRAQTS